MTIILQLVDQYSGKYIVKISVFFSGKCLNKAFLNNSIKIMCSTYKTHLIYYTVLMSETYCH